MLPIITQFFGIMGFILSILTYQQNTHKRIVILQVFSAMSFALHFYMLGAFTGAILNVIAFIRSIVYYFKDKKWASSNLWIVFFAAISTIAGIVTWQDIFSILPILAMIFTGIAFGLRDPKLTRRFALPSSPLWMIYNIYSFSLGGILTETFNIISVLIGMLRFDKKKNEETV